VYDDLVSAEERRRQSGNAFLLAQLGAHAAARFAERISGLDLTPAQAGLLRLIDRGPGQSQQAVAAALRIPPSRLVPLVDGLEARGLIERRRNPADRRNHALYLTEQGARFMKDELRRAGTAHEDDICAGLSDAERKQLNELLTRLADRQGLTAGVHPGYQRIGAKASLTHRCP
jgi:DNA-binding MarR family transcriptional regulator